MRHRGTRSAGTVGTGWRLDEMTLELFSNFNDSVTRRAKPCQTSQQRVRGALRLRLTLLLSYVPSRPPVPPSARNPQQHPAFSQLPRPRPSRHSGPGRAASRSRHLLLPVVEAHAALLEHQRLSQLQQPAGPGEPIHGGPGGTLRSLGETRPQPPLSSGRQRASRALPQPLQPRRRGALRRQPEERPPFSRHSALQRRLRERPPSSRRGAGSTIGPFNSRGRPIREAERGGDFKRRGRSLPVRPWQRGSPRSSPPAADPSRGTEVRLRPGAVLGRISCRPACPQSWVRGELISEGEAQGLCCPSVRCALCVSLRALLAPGSFGLVGGQAGPGSEQPHLTAGVPVHCWEVVLYNLSGSLRYVNGIYRQASRKNKMGPNFFPLVWFRFLLA